MCSSMKRWTRAMSARVFWLCSKITAGLRRKWGSGFQDHDAGKSGGAVDLAVAKAGAFDLTAFGAAAQLLDVLVDLAQAGRADRLAAGQAPAVGVDRQGAAETGRALGDQLLLFAVGAEAVLGHMHDLGAGLGVLDLGDADVLRPDAGHLETGLGGQLGRRGSALDVQRRREHLERAVDPR